LYGSVSGEQNTAVGFKSCRYLSDGSNLKTTGDNGTYIGTYTKASANGLTNENVFGYNAIGSGSNTVTYGDSNITQHNFRNGYVQLNSKTSQESAPLGGELLSASGWTSTDWTGDFTTGFTHTIGNQTVLSNTLAAVVSSYYLITVTVVGRTAGSVNITFGGVGAYGINNNYSFGLHSSSTNAIEVFPSLDFDGTITVSIKLVTGLCEGIFQVKDSAGAVSCEINSSLASLYNTFFGVDSGVINISGEYNCSFGTLAFSSNISGTNNSAFGYRALASNISGVANVAIGGDVLSANTEGSHNTAVGINALRYNIGTANTAFGNSALRFNVGGEWNAAFGTHAGSYLADGITERTSGSNNVYLGTYTKASANSVSNENVIGYGAIGSGSNTVTYGDSNITQHNLRTGKITNNEMTIYQAKVSVADDGTITLVAGANGMLEVWTDAEYMKVYVAADATITSIYGSANTAITDSDTDLCVYDSGTSAIIKNRLGGTKNVGYVFNSIV
jgi:hypothetical protein